MDIFNIDDSPTAKVRAEWESLRRDLGKLMCYIDGTVQGVTTIHQAREQGYKKGYKEGSEKWSAECSLFNDILTLGESDRKLVRQFVKRLIIGKEND